jgi:hypothetical protein
VLSLRELGRATLARQLLLSRVSLSPVEAVSRLGALQAQRPDSPYFALWSRLSAVDVDEVHASMDAYQLVRATLHRRTLHVVTAADYFDYAVFTEWSGRRDWRDLEGLLDVDEVIEATLSFSDEEPRALAEFATLAEERWPHALHLLSGAHNYRHLRTHALLLLTPECSRFSGRGSVAYVSARSRLGAESWPTGEEALPRLVLAYLRAFGPAGTDDVMSWLRESRVTMVRKALASLGDAVTTFADGAGRTLYDVVDGPRPDGETPVPVRYLPPFDSLLLAHTAKFRTRVLPEGYRDRIVNKGNGMMAPTFLVDGFVAGTWLVTTKKSEATLTVQPFVKLSRADRKALLTEGESLVRFAAPDAKSHQVLVEDPA